MSDQCTCPVCVPERHDQARRNRRRGLRPMFPPVAATRDAAAGATTDDSFPSHAGSHSDG